jgi:hypothetical protein
MLFGPLGCVAFNLTFMDAESPALYTYLTFLNIIMYNVTDHNMLIWLNFQC